ncbi:MAG TPA: hypothetical protein ENJ95_09925 [Bacteroidetes bacterium]|nr:hypothetical protein [Bacteroidota bacterium]
MDNPLQNIEQTFEVNLPQQDSLDDYLDEVLPTIRQWSEDLREMKFFVMDGGKPWLEIRDDPGFMEQVLHFFNEGGEYLQSVDGNVSRGKWRLLDQTNKIIIEQGGGGGGRGGGSAAKSELYELAFLNAGFFILKKHGDQGRKKKRKYLFMGYEPVVKGLKWLDCVELLFNEYRNQWGSFQWAVVAAVVLVLALLLYSLF